MDYKDGNRCALCHLGLLLSLLESFQSAIEPSCILGGVMCEIDLLVVVVVVVVTVVPGGCRS
jgi:hypothetical protein